MFSQSSGGLEQWSPVLFLEIPTGFISKQIPNIDDQELLKMIDGKVSMMMVEANVFWE